MEMLLPQVGVPADAGRRKQLQPAPAGGAAARPRRGAATDEDEPPEVEIEATLTFSDREVLQHKDFEQMSQAEIDEALRAIARAAPAGPGAAHAALPAGAARPARRFPRLAAPGAAAGRPDRAAPARAAPPAAAARHPVRHLRLDEPLHAHVPAFHARDDQRPRPRLLLHLRHAAQQHHPRPAQSGRRCGAGRRRRRRSRTGRAARASASPCTSSTAVVAPRAGAGRGGAADHRRARPRGRGGPGRGDGAAAQVLPPADLAQPALALRGLRAQVSGQQGDAAPCRRVPAGAQSRKPGRPDRRAGRRRRSRRRQAAGGMADANCARSEDA